MSRDPALFLAEMRTALMDILEFTQGMSREAFLADKKVRLAVIRCFEIIGEAAKGLSAEVRGMDPSLDWKGICGMRDRLIHQYFGIDDEVVWEAVEVDVQPILAAIIRIQANLPSRQ
jgi:uncharacterized protein with HEPN domain